ncbi:hypothetical protein SAMN05216328_1454 [Ensifer sp. YR511]|nr:hypothetical protein SAMN05216328_1454 [Ensifer sp. YR511]
MPLKFHPAAIRPYVRVNRPKFLDQLRVEFSGLSQRSGLATLPGFISESGALLPIAPWGRNTVVSAPTLHLFAGVRKGQEPMLVQALRRKRPLKASIKALSVGYPAVRSPRSRPWHGSTGRDRETQILYPDRHGSSSDSQPAGTPVPAFAPRLHRDAVTRIKHWYVAREGVDHRSANATRLSREPAVSFRSRADHARSPSPTRRSDRSPSADLPEALP